MTCRCRYPTEACKTKRPGCTEADEPFGGDLMRLT